jgi:hypothetical protein
MAYARSVPFPLRTAKNQNNDRPGSAKMGLVCRRILTTDQSGAQLCGAPEWGDVVPYRPGFQQDQPVADEGLT